MNTLEQEKLLSAEMPDSPTAPRRSPRAAMPRTNNFDLLRLLLAAMVVLAHCRDLSMEPSLAWIGRLDNSRLAVEGFFAMSGCLIIASYDQTVSIRSYFKKRARRILPAYWAAFLFTMVLGAIFTSLPIATFFKSPATWKYVFANLSFANFLHPTLPGLFAANPKEASVNGALWTIKIEVMFYLLVPALVWLCRKLGKWQTLSAVFFASVLFRVGCERTGHPSLALQLPGQLAFFAIGGLVYYYFPQFRARSAWMWLLVVVSYIAYFACGWMVFRALGTSLGVMCVGFLLPVFRGPTKYGDFSYGMYVFHFPIIQLLITLGLFHTAPRLAMLVVAAAATLLAIASWNLVEKQFLKRGQKALSSPLAECRS